MNDEERQERVEKQLEGAEAANRKAFSDEMAANRKEFEETHKKDLALTEEQQQWVEKQIEAVKQQTRILKEPSKKGEDEYEDFTQEDKEMMLPVIRLGLSLNTRGNADSNVRVFLRGKYYSVVQDAMERNNIRKFRGFIALTDFTHTSVYQDIKIAQNYSLDDIRAAHGVNKKTLYTVAVREGDGSAKALKDHHDDLVKAKTPDDVKKALDPKYVPPKKPGPETAISPDGRIKAEFYEPGTKGKGRIVIVPTEGNVGVSYEYWTDFQLWFANQDSWNRFMVWKKLKDEEAAEREDESDSADEEPEEESTRFTNDESEPTLGLEDTVKFHQEIWGDDAFTHADDGNVNARSHLGLEDNDEKDVETRGDLFVEYLGEDGAKQVLRETIFGSGFPATSVEVTELMEKVVQEHPKALYAGIYEQDEFYVGARFVEGAPEIRWSNTIG